MKKTLKSKLAGPVLFIVVALLLLFFAYKCYDNSRSVSEDAYDELIIDAAKRNGIEPSLVKAVIKRESSFKKNAKGKAGEIGLMQLMSGAVTDWAKTNKKFKPLKFQLYDPKTNIEIGTWYLAHCRKRYDGYVSKEILGLAEYNAGYSRVKKWKPEDPNTEFKIEDIGIESTQQYVAKILEYRQKYLDLDQR